MHLSFAVFFICILFLKIYFIQVWLAYNVVLVSTVQQSDSVVNIYVFCFLFFSIMVYHRILTQLPVLYSRTLFILGNKLDFLQLSSVTSLTQMKFLALTQGCVCSAFCAILSDHQDLSNHQGSIYIFAAWLCCFLLLSSANTQCFPLYKK